MTQTVTIELPDTIYLPAQRTAEATRRPLTDVLINALKASLPPLDGLSPALFAELVKLEQLDDKRLWQVMLSQVPADKQRKLDRLLQKSKREKLSDPEQSALEALQEEADRVMLRKARSAVILRFRGHRLPTLTELRKLTQSRSK